MNMVVFISLLAAFSAVTGLLVECAKKLLSEKPVHYSSNLLTLIMGAVVGVGGSAIYYILCAVPFTTQNIILMCLMGLASAVGAMVGYDKVIQTIEQFKK